MQYAALLSKNDEYKGDVWRTLGDLYEGGFSMCAKASDYLTKEPNEEPARYQARIRSASYINYLGMLVDAYVSELFSQELSIVDKNESVEQEYWDEFGYDADLQGNDFSSVLKGAIGSLLLNGKALVQCDFPALESEPGSRLEEDIMGASRGYCFEVPAQSLTDWGYAARVTRTQNVNGKQVKYQVGRLKWAIVKSTVSGRQDPTKAPATPFDQYQVWTLDESGFAKWERYEIKPNDKGELPKPEDMVSPSSAGVTSFREIPIVEIKISHGKWIGNKLGPLALEHFRRRSELIASQKKSLFAIPIAYLGPEVGAVGGSQPAELAGDPNRGNDPASQFTRKGFMVLGSEDRFAYASPDTAVYSVVDGELKDLVDEMHRIVAQIASGVSATSNSIGRSGHSKSLDRKGTTISLTSYAAIAKDAAERIYQLISDARLEDAKWEASGMSEFEQEDRAELVSESAQIDGLNIPSPTFKTAYLTRLALALVGNTSDETSNAIRDEIKAAGKIKLIAEPLKPMPPKLGLKKTLVAPPESSGELPDSADA